MAALIHSFTKILQLTGKQIGSLIGQNGIRFEGKLE